MGRLPLCLIGNSGQLPSGPYLYRQTSTHTLGLSKSFVHVIEIIRAAGKNIYDVEMQSVGRTSWPRR